ncbi:MAG: hypothetical protein K6B41_02175 [Butyrivibrio sp.]|nr:hypothetical protein [Butyrivibrio sp.]
MARGNFKTGMSAMLENSRKGIIESSTKDTSEREVYKGYNVSNKSNDSEQNKGTSPIKERKIPEKTTSTKPEESASKTLISSSLESINKELDSKMDKLKEKQDSLEKALSFTVDTTKDNKTEKKVSIPEITKETEIISSPITIDTSIIDKIENKEPIVTKPENQNVPSTYNKSKTPDYEHDIIVGTNGKNYAVIEPYTNLTIVRDVKTSTGTTKEKVIHEIDGITMGRKGESQPKKNCTFRPECYDYVDKAAKFYGKKFNTMLDLIIREYMLNHEPQWYTPEN